jgi:hypothetical protein
MGRRARRRRAEGAGPPDLPAAPESTYALGGDDALVLRGVLSPATRREYGDVGAGVREDAWHRRVEFLFERLAVRWEVAGVAYAGPKQLLERFRAASGDERSAIRDALRRHAAEHFPELDPP